MAVCKSVTIPGMTGHVRRNTHQEHLAYAAGIDRSYVGKMERGEVNLTIEKLYLLAKTLGCSPKDLIPEA